MQPQLKIYHGKHIIKCKIVLKIKFKEQTQVNYQTTSWWTLCAKWICFHQRHYHVFSDVMDWSSYFHSLWETSAIPVWWWCWDKGNAPHFIIKQDDS